MGNKGVMTLFTPSSITFRGVRADSRVQTRCTITQITATQACSAMIDDDVKKAGLNEKAAYARRSRYDPGTVIPL